MKYEAIVKKKSVEDHKKKDVTKNRGIDAKSANESRHPMTFRRKHKRDIRGVEEKRESRNRSDCHNAKRQRERARDRWREGKAIEMLEMYLCEVMYKRSDQFAICLNSVSD